MLYTLPSLVILSHQSNRFSLPSGLPIPLPPTFQPASLLTFQRFSPPSEVRVAKLSLFCCSLHQECFTTPFQSCASTLFLKSAGVAPPLASPFLKFYFNFFANFSALVYKSLFFSPFLFKSLRTLPSYVCCKSFACHSYENCRVYTNNSHSGTRSQQRTTVPASHCAAQRPRYSRSSAIEQRP